MRSFAGAFAELAFDLSLELRATGRADLARELEVSVVKSVSYDPETDVGWVALEPQRKLNTVERNVVGQKLGQAISFSDTPYAAMQLDNFGRIDNGREGDVGLLSQRNGRMELIVEYRANRTGGRSPFNSNVASSPFGTAGPERRHAAGTLMHPLAQTL